MHMQQVMWPFSIKEAGCGGGGGSVTQDLQEVGSLKAHTGSNASGASLQLEPTVFNWIECF